MQRFSFTCLFHYFLCEEPFRRRKSLSSQEGETETFLPKRREDGRDDDDEMVDSDDVNRQKTVETKTFQPPKPFRNLSQMFGKED